MKKTLALLMSLFHAYIDLPSPPLRGKDLQARIDAAKVVLDEIMAAQDNSIPMDILQPATCVGVVPGMKKGALGWGGQYGQGVVTCRTGHGWSAPVFIRMAGVPSAFRSAANPQTWCWWLSMTAAFRICSIANSRLAATPRPRQAL